MSISNFVPEVWAAELLDLLYKSLVYAGTPCVNRDYEGEIANFGDTVHIVSIANGTIQTYTKDTDLNIETLSDSDLTLLIDQAKAFAFEVDDIDRRQARNGGALMSQAAKQYAYLLRDTADQYVASKMIDGADSANDLGDVDATTPANVYENLVIPAKVKLDQANAPTEGRWLVIDPATHGQMLLDNRFVTVNESGTSEGLRNGIVGRVGGFNVALSNNAPTSNRTGLTATTHSGTKVIDGAAAGTFNQGDKGLSITGTGVGSSNTIASVSDDGTSVTTTVNSSASATVNDIAISGGGQVAIAGHQMAVTYAEQINNVEAFRPQKRFADALKGLHLYGAKVVRPELLVVGSVTVS